MKEVIFYRTTIRECEIACRELGYIPRNCIFLTSPILSNYNRDRIRGYWKEVMNNEIELNGLSKNTFLSIYQFI